MSVEWKWCQGAISRQAVADLEAEWGIQFPEDYVQCVMRYNGGVPQPDAIDILGWGETLFQGLISITEPEDPREPSMRKVYETLKRRLPAGVYPFGVEPGGNLFCFDYRKLDNNRPRVVFWYHEREDSDDPSRAIYPVCNSFTELADMLHEGE